MDGSFLAVIDNILVIAIDIAIICILVKKLYKALKKYISRRQ